MLVSLNFEKDPDNNEQVHICELNKITHLKYDSDLTTDAKFYYRGWVTNRFFEILAFHLYNNDN